MLLTLDTDEDARNDINHIDDDQGKHDAQECKDAFLVQAKTALYISGRH